MCVCTPQSFITYMYYIDILYIYEEFSKKSGSAVWKNTTFDGWFFSMWVSFGIVRDKHLYCLLDDVVKKTGLGVYLLLKNTVMKTDCNCQWTTRYGRLFLQVWVSLNEIVDENYNCYFKNNNNRLTICCNNWTIFFVTPF